MRGPPPRVSILSVFHYFYAFIGNYYCSILLQLVYNTFLCGFAAYASAYDGSSYDATKYSCYRVVGRDDVRYCSYMAIVLEYFS